jgi:PAS domain-containing protein
MMHLEAALTHQRDLTPRARTEWDLAWSLLGQSIREARAVMSGIHPPVLDERGIVAAIEYLIAEHHASGDTSVTFQHAMTKEEISPLIEVTLFRVLQQALANIRQHSEAEEASVRLEQLDDRVLLEIRDSGTGFDAGELLQDDHVGIRGMKDRVESLQGSLDISSSDMGTSIVVELPACDALGREHRRRRQVEQEIRVVNERLRLVLQASTDAIRDCDVMSRTVSWNGGYNTLFGEDPPDSGDSWHWWVDHIHSDDRERVSTSLDAATASAPNYGDRWSETYRYRRVDGTYALIVDRAIIARDDDGRAVRIIGSLLESGP